MAKKAASLTQTTDMPACSPSAFRPAGADPGVRVRSHLESVSESASALVPVVPVGFGVAVAAPVQLGDELLDLKALISPKISAGQFHIQAVVRRST